MDDYMEYFVREGVYEIGFLSHKEDESFADESSAVASYNYDGEKVKIAGIIKELKLFYTKKDQKPMYVYLLEDKSGDMKSVVFNDRLELNQDKLVDGKVVIVEGQLKQDDFGIQIIVRNMYDIEALAKSEKPKAIWIRLIHKQQFEEVSKICKQNPGDLPVYLYFNGKAFESNGKINLNFATFSKLQEHFGENVKVTYHK
ncbi:OB-fold nucleic acid binding domain-containing protein (plasmid) [Aneurinibacillus sp. Ricciae_BoGa-3]|uniref:OB-fold nucleic acid binding domain-containing protein n=1 Tax=Aneurinibacillus sp. Ricciae_BoGa-3 TaxID=3022697 RepID=UPI00233FD126|nr:OB-fold nucleic acid binding domain-containing protein [Aneurinibacillus sp. Ricciae_BoGa-3]WCK56968.1 OB-fold nucleic acid binding domain-containing protein [Aneurinibacillus sp. Ricciae_BoGa-3]